MAAPVVLDVTRLALRFQQPVPDGMGRVDLSFGDHFVRGRQDGCSVVLTVLGPRVVPNAAAGVIVSELAQYWQEAVQPEADPGLRYIAARLQPAAGPLPVMRPSRLPRSWRSLARHAGRVFRDAPLLGRSALFPGGDPSRTLPRDAIYLNVGFSPLHTPAYFRFLQRRPDVKRAFLLHDQLPVQFPEYFLAKTRADHERALGTILSLASAIIVTGDVTRAALADYCRIRNWPLPPILVAPLAVTPVFREPQVFDPALAATPYLVTCGTIEPRKNHLALLQIWRDMAVRMGPETPKLVIVGTRGWENENVIDMLDRCDAIRPHVIEIARLSTPALKRLLDNARGLLMPSFGEGFGLPVAEALAVGTPVVASDIAAFRNFRTAGAALIDPIDAPAWRTEILRLAARPGPQPRPDRQQPDWTDVDYFRNIESFLVSL